MNFCRLSKFDHSCAPNSFVVYDGCAATVRRFDPAAADDAQPITISYVDILSPRRTRLKQLFVRAVLMRLNEY